MPNIGYVTLTLAFTLAIYATVVAVVGARRRVPELIASARNAAFGVTGLITVTVIILEYLLIVGHYQTKYVYEVSNRAAPLFYRVTALWGGQDGSLLFWSWPMSIFAALVLFRKWGSMRLLMPYVMAMTQVTLAFFMLLALFEADPTQAHDPSPNPLSEIDFKQKLNEPAPLDLTFRDEAGESVLLGDYFGDKPVVLIFAYYGCKTLCSVVLEELVESLRALKFDVGNQFRVVTVSIDPRDTPALAAEKKAIHIEHYGRPGAADGWHFLTGEHTAIDQLAETVGFRYAYDAQLDQYAHPAGIVILTPQGKMSRYFFGFVYSPTDLRLGLVEASAHKIGSFIDQVLLRCFQYDPVAARYTPIVMNILRLVGLTTALTLVTSILVMLRWERRRKNLQLDHTTKQEKPT